MTVPNMTGPASPDGIVTQSGTFGATFEGWRAFDSSNSTMWLSAVNQTPAWIGYEYANGPRRVVSYTIRYVNGSIVTRAPKDWTFQGWNGFGWVVIDTRSNQVNWGGVEERTYTVASPGFYSRYRLNIIDDNDSRSGVVVISIGKLSLLADSSVPAMTGPNTPTGTVIQSGSFGAGFEGWRGFDSNNNSMWISAVNQTPAWLGYVYGAGSKRVVSYSIRYVNGSIVTRAPKTWTFQGWNGFAWVVIDIRNNETNWSGIEERSYTVAAPGFYSAYMLHVTDDNDSRPGVVVISLGKLSLISDS